jgi:uncharacterized protein involved in exopolysaccharide biosynthesis
MNTNETNNDEISVKEVFRILWKGRFLIVGITFAIVVATAVTALILIKKYDAILIVSPVADDSSGGRLSSLVSQVGGGGLAALTGLAGLPGGSNTQKAETIAVLQSEKLTESFIQNNDLLPILYSEKWDASRQRWKVNDPKTVPTVWKANRYFRSEIRTIATDTKTGLVTLTIRWRDPKVAANWANDLVKMTNDYLRKKTMDEAGRNISYLSDQAAITEAVGVKEGIYAILLNEIKKMMLARGSEEYALKVIDPAVPPEKPSTPRPILWTTMALFAGLFLSITIVIARHWWRTTP